jgi:hypothetical protein
VVFIYWNNLWREHDANKTTLIIPGVAPMDSMAIIRTAIESKEYSDLALKNFPVSGVISVFYPRKIPYPNSQRKNQLI